MISPALPHQAPPAAEPHTGLLPAGEPAQHGVGVHAHLGDLRAGARRGRLPLHGLRLAGDVRLLERRLWGGAWGGGRLRVLGGKGEGHRR